MPKAKDLASFLRSIDVTSSRANQTGKIPLQPGSAPSLPCSPSVIGSSSEADSVPGCSASNVLLQCRDLRQKTIYRKRKMQLFNRSNNNRIDNVVMKSSRILGSKAFQVLEQLGRVTGEKDYNSLIKLCLDEALRSDDDKIVSECISDALRHIEALKNKGFPLKEETYGPVLMCMIEKGMSNEFHLLIKVLGGEDNRSIQRLGYYMLRLYIRLNDVRKIEEFLEVISKNEAVATSSREQYLLAFCETDQRDLICQLLEKFDIRKVSSVHNLISIFQSLGRLHLDSLAERLLPTIVESCYGANISPIICNYTTHISNSTVKDVVSKFEDLHRVVNVNPTLESYEMIVFHCCKSLEIHLALDIAERMCEAGFSLSLSMVQHLCRACDESVEFNLIKRIYSLIWRKGLKPDTLTFKSLIKLCMKMNDFEGGFNMLQDMRKMKLKPAAEIYNLFLGGYFRARDIDGALRVLGMMNDEGVEPDSSTYSYLIGNSENEEQIVELFEKMKLSGVKPLKQVFVALINAYASCKHYDKAKQVIFDQNIPTNDLDEIKSKLIVALALRGQFWDAVDLFHQMKKAGSSVDAKAIIALIENFQTTDNSVDKLLELLDELHDHDSWVDGCYRAISLCVRHKHQSSIVHLLKQLYTRCCNDELALEYIFDEIFAEISDAEAVDMDLGLELLRVIKLEIGVLPSRKTLDFLLNASIKSKNLKLSLLVWKEYDKAGLPYNVITYLRMYQALLASNSVELARATLSRFPTHDFHVSLVIQACKNLYMNPSASNKNT